MRPGPPPAVRRVLNPAFRAAVRHEIRSGRRSWVLARIAGFPQPQMLSNYLHAPVVRATPLTVERFTRLAESIGFDGALFVEHADAEQQA